jgi:hypothetical protein
MGSLSNYGERLALDVASGYVNDLSSFSSDRYVALYVGGTPFEDGTLPAGVQEVSGNGYARTQVIFSASTINGLGKAEVKNNSNVAFPVASGGPWGIVESIAVWDEDGTGAPGNMIWVGSLTSIKSVDESDQLVFFTGNITLTMD